MAYDYTFQPLGYCFSGNPINARAIVGEDNSWSRYEIKVGGRPVYSGRFSHELNADISEIVDASLDYFRESRSSDPISPVAVDQDGFDRKQIVEMSVFNEEDDEFVFEPAFAMKGGVPKRLLGKVDPDDGIFGERFLRPGNIFFTSRTAGRTIVIKETELAPLYFLVHNTLALEIRTEVGRAGRTFAFDCDRNGIWSLDIANLRRWFYENHEIISSQFEVYGHDVYCCTILVEQAAVVRDRYRLKFRNSFGFYEIVELCDAATQEVFGGENGSEYRVDDYYGGLSRRRPRIVKPTTLTVGSGPKRLEEIRLLEDAIASEEVYLLDYLDEPVRVIPSAEAFTVGVNPAEPQSVTLKLTVADEDCRLSPDTLPVAGRIHTQQFDSKFN